MTDPCRYRRCKWWIGTTTCQCDYMAAQEGTPVKDYCVDWHNRQAYGLLYEVAVAAPVDDDPRMHYVEIQLDRETWEKIRALMRIPVVPG